jgi:DNA-binding IscR family transcriptional regulator
MIVLGTIAHQGEVDVEDVAERLKVPVVIVETICADLEASGLVGPARGHWVEGRRARTP